LKGKFFFRNFLSFRHIIGDFAELLVPDSPFLAGTGSYAADLSSEKLGPAFLDEVMVSSQYFRVLRLMETLSSI
jgi:hypothetical protein